jgi:maltooligosyltrehalose trehalohydrolase
VGNRALGTRLSHHVDVDAHCAASVLLLFLPATPLVFRGQEWASSSPFPFFSDHEGDLAEAVRRGRREELKSFAAFADPEQRARIPDPQDRATFEQSKLRWDERTESHHARVLGIYRAMLALRRSDPVLSAPTWWSDLEATAHGDVLVVTRRRGDESQRLVVSFPRRRRTRAGSHARRADPLRQRGRRRRPTRRTQRGRPRERFAAPPQ